MISVSSIVTVESWIAVPMVSGGESSDAFMRAGWSNTSRKGDLDRVQDREQGVLVPLDLVPLVAVAGVLDGEIVQPNSLCVLASSSALASFSATKAKQRGASRSR